MKLAVIAIGDELLIGQVVDTNSGEIARIIHPAGWEIDSVRVVGDSADDIRVAIEEAFSHADVVVTTGGLGPTKDDITKHVLCEIFGGRLRFDQSVLDNIYNVFERRGLTINKLTEQQAYVPTSCTVIQNRVGTAPVMWFERDGKVLIALPGVPFEMRDAFVGEVFPRLCERFPSDSFLSRTTLIVTGITESALAERLDDWEKNLPHNFHLAYLPVPGYIRLRLNGIGGDKKLLDEEMNRLKAELCSLLVDCLLCDDDISPEELLLRRLRSASLTFASAESCTGGNIAHRITLIPGCSDVYVGSVVSYANEVKTSILGVPEEMIETHGAVSEQVALRMAEGVAKVTGADCSVATSGIAGPSGAVEGKPVGTVCIALCTPRGKVARTFHFPGTRSRVIDRASTMALIGLIRLLEREL